MYERYFQEGDFASQIRPWKTGPMEDGPHGRRFTATGMSNSLKFLSFFWQHIYACASSEIESSN